MLQLSAASGRAGTEALLRGNHIFCSEFSIWPVYVCDVRCGRLNGHESTGRHA